jgi:hypothetical protein
LFALSLTHAKLLPFKNKDINENINSKIPRMPKKFANIVRHISIFGSFSGLDDICLAFHDSADYNPIHGHRNPI